MPKGVFLRTADHSRNISLALRGKKKNYRVWNKGLTKEVDSRLLDLSQKVSKTLTGRKRQASSIRKQSESLIKLLKKPEIKAKYSKARIGNKNPNWQGGIDKDPYPFYFNYELKAKIRDRDSHVCQLCGITEEEELNKVRRNLAINHIDYNKRNNDPSNLITLCMSCNSKVNYNRKYWTKYFQDLLKQLTIKNLGINES